MKQTTIRVNVKTAAKIKRRADKLGVSVAQYLDIVFEPRVAGSFMETIAMISQPLDKKATT